MKLCKYTPADEQVCLTIFDGNTPPFFAPEERELFAGYLHRVAPPYFYFLVRDDDGSALACGGMNFDTSGGCATLRWDMVAREYHHRGIGAFLVLSRLSLICQVPEIQTVLLGTSQYAQRFYEKMGFASHRITQDGIAPGLDEYIMQMKLDEKIRGRLGPFGKEKLLAWETT
jgi:GNAT superfamily N-acetyltransferase